ncbi:hypothetical protein [Porphyromonas sp.]|uniref:fibronectin type III domain-containing protein n=1 Tax=Porphyromonas sp. TaxID=1924944 RepID=UPI0026DCF94C|nr:hypothetical protein [Porphyromonas sp.]MDO4771275.1 hypothetical protein [Porphyromonas sp.]
MMKTKILLILTTILALGHPFSLRAQDNLIINGGFEKFVAGGLSQRPEGWVVPYSLSPEQKEGQRPGGDGSYYMRIYTNSGSFYTLHNADAPNLPVTEGKAYRLTFWHRGNKSNIAYNVRMSWYEGDQRKDTSKYFEFKTTTSWQEEEVYFRVPEGKGIHRGELGFAIRSKSGGSIDFDDVVLQEFDGEIPEPLTPPTNIKAVRHQREIELSWDPVNDPKRTWEVFIGSRMFTDIKTNSFTIENLNPGTSYLVRIRAAQGEKKSDFSDPVRYTTAALERAKDAPDRTPYLRTVEPVGNVKQRRIKPYFNDLGSNKATITYSLNGTPVELQDGYLVFPGKGYHRLGVTIDEGDGKKWKLTYRIYVVN